jgi:hypothetical protein
LGVQQARVVVGEALWRVGDGDGDVIAHARGYATPPSDDAPYHAWIRIGTDILDTTTYQLPRKAAELSALDGQPLDVQWCPDFLLVPVAQSSSREAVLDGRTGLFHYREDQALRRALLSAHADGAAHDGYLLTETSVPSTVLRGAPLLYRQPHLCVLGVNNLERSAA